jgi:hypothetical protein
MSHETNLTIVCTCKIVSLFYKIGPHGGEENKLVHRSQSKLHRCAIETRDSRVATQDGAIKFGSNQLCPTKFGSNQLCSYKVWLEPSVLAHISYLPREYGVKNIPLNPLLTIFLLIPW